MEKSPSAPHSFPTVLDYYLDLKRNYIFIHFDLILIWISKVDI